MGFHHVAIATRDLAGTHTFYTEAMGFRLVKAVVAETGAQAGDAGQHWAKHLFYDTGDGSLIAFWELHDDAIAPGWSPAISTGLGLPEWVNHLAFDLPTLAALDAARQRWVDTGLSVMEIDHGFCRSVYTMDPNGVLVEFCTTTQPFTESDRRHAEQVLNDPAPSVQPAPTPRFFRPARHDALR